MKDRSIETEAVHAGRGADAPKGRPSATPIYTASTYEFDSMADSDAVFAGELEDYIYVRHGNPTVDALQEAICVLERGSAARCFASGMAALHASFLAAGLRSGDTVVASKDMYGASLALLDHVFGPFEVKPYLADFSDLESLRNLCENERPRFLLGETISNPLLKVLDIGEVADIAHAVDARLIVDSTFATPYLARPLEDGADFVVHSATKYLGGHGDAIGGVVVVRDAADESALTRTMRLVGGIMSVWEADRIARGIKTLALRMERQCANAAKLAEWLRSREEVATVHYPNLGAIVSLILADDSREAAWRFMDALKMCVRATTLGDVHTSVSHSASSSHREFADERRRELGIADGLVRVSVGIENIDDIIADVEQALR